MAKKSQKIADTNDFTLELVIKQKKTLTISQIRNVIKGLKKEVSDEIDAAMNDYMQCSQIAVRFLIETEYDKVKKYFPHWTGIEFSEDCDRIYIMAGDDLAQETHSRPRKAARLMDLCGIYNTLEDLG